MDRYIIADSTFYICFLDDIKKPCILLQIMNSFHFCFTPLILNEIKKSTNYRSLFDNTRIQTIEFEFEYGEIFKPFLSKDKVIKGEAEVIALSAILYKSGKLQNLILDEGEARGFIQRNLSYLNRFMIGTLGFIGNCHCDKKIIDKNVALELLELIKNSKFRIEEKILNSIRAIIQRC